QSTSAIALDWNNSPESDLAGYNVYRSASQFGTFVKLNAGLLASSDFNDTGAPATTTSYYRITAVDLDGNESVAATTSTIRPADTTPPAVPANLTLSADVSGVTLDWDDNTDGDLGGYNVYSSTSAGGPFTKLNSTPL